MRRFGWIAILAAAALSAPAAAQTSDKESFIEAVKSRDGSKAMALLKSRGPTVIDGRSLSGETALLTAIGNRDSTWTGFLLQEGADPNLSGRNGETPLIAASRIGFDEAVEKLLARGAKVDATNRVGETALIVAVQQRHTPIVKALLAEGADPDKADSAAGYSARDYAKRDTRARDILALIESTQRKSDKLEDFKL